MNFLYILEGKIPKPIDDVMEWSKFMATAERTVVYTLLKDCFVSTVFTGINGSFFLDDPHLFETMIIGGQHDMYLKRYRTWEEAEAGHQKAIELVFTV